MSKQECWALICVFGIMIILHLPKFNCYSSAITQFTHAKFTKCHIVYSCQVLKKLRTTFFPSFASFFEFEFPQETAEL